MRIRSSSNCIHHQPCLNVGDYVRLLNPSSVFKKGYARQWTNEVFRIRMRNLTGAFALYKVEDLHGEDIEGFFYRSELHQTIKPSRWVIDRILHSGDGKNLVRWRDRGYKDDAEVTEKDIKKYIVLSVSVLVVVTSLYSSVVYCYLMCTD